MSFFHTHTSFYYIIYAKSTFFTKTRDNTKITDQEYYWSVTKMLYRHPHNTCTVGWKSRAKARCQKADVSCPK